MASSPRRVVITGIGVVSPIGVSLDAFWDSLRHGRGGIHRIQTYDPTGLPTPFGGEILDFDPRVFVDKKDRKRLGQMARAFQLAVCAAQLAVDGSRLDKSGLDPERFGVFFGSSCLPGELGECGPAAQLCTDRERGQVDLQKWGADGMSLIPPMWLLNYIPNIVSCHVSILHNAQGPSNTVTQSDAGGLLALGEAMRVIQRDKADVALVGGSDTKALPVSMVRYSLMQQTSRRAQSPEQASRPFDRDRDGMVLGEGSGVLVLEELEHARRRHAPIYAEVAGFASGLDGKRSGDGLARVIRRALEEAAIRPEQLDHANAHGYSTTREDAWEARGLRQALNNDRHSIPVLAVKSYIGNIGPAGGPIELAASLLALRHGVLPATLNYETPDPACPIEVVRKPRPVERESVLKVSLTEMGQCAAVALKKV